MSGPVTPADETALRRRLHDELDTPAVPPAPAEAVFRRYRAARARRLTVIGCVAAVAAVAAGVAVLHPSGEPPGRPAGPVAGTHVFASGISGGRHWRLAVANLAYVRPWCLPGVVLNGQQGDLLQPGFLPGWPLGNTAFLAVTPGRPGIGFGFLRLRPGVSAVTAHFGDGTSARLRPVTVAECGQSFRLAGFEWPRQGVKRITGRSPQGRPAAFTPPAAIFDPASSWQAGTWVNLQGATGEAASGDIGSGRTGGMSWSMRVTLGPDGECFALESPPGGGGGAAGLCQPVGEAPQTASFAPIPYRGTRLNIVWYPGTVRAGAAYLLVHLSNGTTRRVAPAMVAGRRYIAFAVAGTVRVTRITLYGADGGVLAHLPGLPGLARNG